MQGGQRDRRRSRHSDCVSLVGGRLMTNPTLLIVAIAVVIAALAIAWMYTMKRRRDRLHQRFGTEYERAVRDTGSARRADALLADREQRVSEYRIRALSTEERAKFSDAWKR